MSDSGLVERYSIWNDTLQCFSGDYLRVNGIELGEAKVSTDLEYERAKSLHPDNPAFHMRRMFFTNSPFASEILELHGIKRPPRQPR